MKWEKKGKIFDPSKANVDWLHSHAQCPTAIVLGDKIRIFYAGRNTAGLSIPTYIDVNADNPNEVLYVHDKPVLDFGELGTFDENGIIPSYFIERDGLIYLYYAGWSQCRNVPYKNFTGVAISKDGGDTFEKFSNAPVFGMNQANPLSATAPGIVTQSGVYHAIYSTGTSWVEVNGKLEHTYLFAHATSEDGIEWKGNGKIVIEAENEFMAHCKPAIVESDGRYHLWFSKRGSHDFRVKGANAYRLGYATSEDFENWQREDELVGIDVSPEGWDSLMICYPHIVKYKDTHYMFYNGNGFGRSGFGYAVLKP